MYTSSNITVSVYKAVELSMVPSISLSILYVLQRQMQSMFLSKYMYFEIIWKSCGFEQPTYSCSTCTLQKYRCHYINMYIGKMPTHRLIYGIQRT